MTEQTTSTQAKARRPLPATDDYIGKGRVAACCARRRYHLQPDADEMNELINHAASVYWYKLQVEAQHPSKAWVAARDRTASYYFRKMRCVRTEWMNEVARPIHLEDPIVPENYGDDAVTYLDRLAAITAVADTQRLDWIDHEALVQTLVEGRQAAGVSKRAISYARNLGTIDNEATIIRLAAQGHTNEAIATLLDTTEGTIRNRRQRIRRWLNALADTLDVAHLVEAWDKSGGNHYRAAVIQGTYPGGRKPR